MKKLRHAFDNFWKISGCDLNFEYSCIHVHVAASKTLTQ